eukprot:COSAG04_NODE_2669_length_3757_cov_4.647348_11_plen_61_part_01
MIYSSLEAKIAYMLAVRRRQAWASTTEEKREKKRLVRKVMLRFRNMHMSQCFTHWSGKIRE